MPVLICLRKKLWTRTYSTRDQVPTCPVFTRVKIKSRFGICRHNRNPETRKTLTTSQYRYKTFYYLWVKRFFNIRREAQSFYAGFSICPHHVRHLPQGHRRAPKVNCLLPRQNSTNWLFSNLSPHFRCVMSLTSLVTSSIWDFYCDISEWHVHPVLVWTPAPMFAPN